MPDTEEKYLQALRGTITYQVGELVVQARSSLSKMFMLPWRLYQLHRIDRRTTKIALAGAPSSIERESLPKPVRKHLLAFELTESDEPDVEELKRLLANSKLARVEQADSLLKAAQLVVTRHPSAAQAMAHLAMEIEPRARTAEQAAFILYRAGNLTAPADLLGKHDSGKRPEARDRIIAEFDVLRNGISLPPRRISPVPAARKNRILYVSHLSLPHHTSGYATRTHSLLRALRAQGHDALCVTRPGYPWDRRDSRAMTEAVSEDVIEGIRYLHLQGLSAGEMPLTVYAGKASHEIARVIEREEPAIVIAGSNYLNALPALMAARMTGRDFYYDIRGLWEYTTASKLAGWERTERFHLSRQIETRLATEATGVFAISSPVKEELVTRGVPAHKISILPNGVEVDRFTVDLAPDGLRETLAIPKESVVFGFIGSMEVYEGIPDLIHAFGRLIESKLDAHLVFVGDGAVAQQAGDLVGALGLIDRIRFIGRVPFSDVPRYYRLCDVFAYPRNATQLTRLVPALKPLEAMAARKPVIISDLPALVELVGGSENAALTPPDDIETLSARMAKLALDAAERARLAEAGWQFAQSRTWEKSTFGIASRLSTELDLLAE